MKFHIGSVLLGTCIGVALVVLMSTMHKETLTSSLRKTSKGAQHFQQLVEEAHKIVEAKKQNGGAATTTDSAALVPANGLVPKHAKKKDHQVVASNEELTARPHHEHIEVLREATNYHLGNKETWEEQSYSQPYLDKEREVACEGDGAAEANEANRKAIEIIRDIIDDDDKAGPNPAFGPALTQFANAIKACPHCATPRLNQVILQAAMLCSFEDRPFLVAIHDIDVLDHQLEAALPFSTNSKVTAKIHWYRGMMEELRTNRSNTARAHFEDAVRFNPHLKEEHVHRTRTMFPLEHLRAVQRPVDYLYRKGLVQLMFYYEFAPRMGGYVKVTYADAQRFLRDWRIKLEKNLPPFVWNVVSRMYRLSFDNPMFPPIIGLYKGAASHESNGDCVNAWYNIRIQQVIEKLTGVKVDPTYGYTAGYEEGDILKPHTDRKACEFTLTTLIQAYPHVSYCPLYAQKTPFKIDRNWIGRYEENTIRYDDAINLHPQLNELLVLRGRAVPHYRPALPKDVYCTTFLQHYVPHGEPER